MNCFLLELCLEIIDIWDGSVLDPWKSSRRNWSQLVVLDNKYHFLDHDTKFQQFMGKRGGGGEKKEKEKKAGGGEKLGG